MHGGTLLLELGAVLFGLGLLARLALRVGLSPIPLYLLAGLAFGDGGLVPLVTAHEFIVTGAEVGVVLLLLVLGLEYSAAELLTVLRRQAPSGVLDLVLNGAPGAIAGWLLGWGPTGAVALAGVTAVSSSGIVAKLLDDLGRLGNRETPSVLSILVLEDLAMALFLPVLTALLVASGPGPTARTVGIAVLTLVLVLTVASRYGEPVSRLVFSDDNEILLLRILGLALLVAGAAQQLQVSAAVGAFLLGIVLSGEVVDSARQLLEPLRDLFAAVFFVFFGLSTDPGQLPPVLLVAALLAVVGAGTKFMTGWVAAARNGVATPGRIRAGAALIPRGEFSIVIAGLAVAGGVDARIGPIATAYVFILAVIGPIAPRLLDPVVRRSTRRAALQHPAAHGEWRRYYSL